MKPATTLALGALSVLSFSLQERSPRDPRAPQRAGDRTQEARDEAEQDDRDGLPEVGNQNVGQLDVFGRRTRNPDDSIVDRIKGGWTLVEMDLEGIKKAGRSSAGFLHIGDAYMAMEVHAFWADTATSSFDIHSSFTAEYSVDATGRLYLRTVIGAYIDERTGLLEWERPGFPRQYEITETESELILRWGGNRNRLVFRPRLPQLQRQVDIFGRQKVLEPGEASFNTDIFGRNQPDDGGARDIFGRVAAPEEGQPEGATGERNGEAVDPRSTPPPNADDRSPEQGRRTRDNDPNRRGGGR